MITWKEERMIDASIERVWDLFKSDNLQTIMPKVEEHRLIEGENGKNGAKYLQRYREGKRVETYTVIEEGYVNESAYKRKQWKFELGNAFEIKLSYSFFQEGGRTRFLYEGENRGINFVGRAMLKLGSDKNQMKVVNEFLDRVSEEAVKRHS
ncbi:SRPBCC family protein [Halobacillus litoralis]|uniref:SRPBCC family protein n=1 Tax=Halobacillus litoralis TaxID=45668 RepID=UPI001CD4030B|nr:SRPBCC family protein [Halobacillus litoralis]MCA0969435.1 SRPBCC family protein [Halobacillus litoralis]